MHRKAKILYLALVVVILLAALSAVAAAQGETPEEKLKALMANLRLVTQQEFATGQKIQTEKGIYLTGESAVKVGSLHRDAAKAYEATIARPASERQAAIASIRAFARQPDLPIEYKSTAKSSYNNNVLIEYYVVGTDYYEVDTRTNQIIQFGPASLPQGETPKSYDSTPRYTSQELEVMARTFIADRIGVDVTKLTSNHGNKGGANYFFRWEDRTRKMNDGTYPFIQIGFTRGGDLLSYTNSLGM
jgi:hypothetical protein